METVWDCSFTAGPTSTGPSPVPGTATKRPPTAPGGLGAAVCVRARGGRRGEGPKAGVDDDERLGVDLAAEGEKLVDAEVIVLDVFPRPLPPRRGAGAR